MTNTVQPSACSLDDRQDPAVPAGVAGSPLRRLVATHADEGTPDAVARIGRLIGVSEGGAVGLIEVEAGLDCVVLRARTTVDLTAANLGSSALYLLTSTPEQAVIVGLLQGTGAALPSALQSRVDLEPDAQRVTLEAGKELVLRCGEASVTLHHDGRVIVSGHEIVTDARGRNRIRGGSVELN